MAWPLQVEEPRSDRLASVLSTLQPDQYRLVSWPHDEPLMVQGHPGTGKTIVATYRAAYLVDPALHDDEGPLAGRRGLRILLVGPTDAYVEHVSEIIRRLYGIGRIRLTHLEQFLGDTTLVKGQWGGGIGGGDRRRGRDAVFRRSPGEAPKRRHYRPGNSPSG